MIRNAPELQEANQKEVVEGEVGTTSRQFVAIVLVTIHVLME
jgi:hypothetical protein